MNRSRFMVAVRAVLLVLGFCGSGAVWAIMDQYTFETAEQQAQFMALIEELRCPKCQNQNLADSNSPIAQDLRDEVYRLMALGRSDAEIVAHLVERYGDFVRYKPPVNRDTLLLWGLPAVLLILAVCVVVLIARKQRFEQGPIALTDEEKARLQTIQEESR